MKFYGKLGYAKTEETKPGVWKNKIVEKSAVGDYVKNAHRFVDANQVNDNVKLSSTISIIADSYAMANFNYIKYVKTFGDVAWKVETVEVQYPRLVLTLGGEYNAQ